MSVTPSSGVRSDTLERLAVLLLEPLGFALELAASSKDIAAARRAYRRRVAGLVDDVGELLDPRRARAIVVGARPRIERDQVDLGWNAAQQPHQLTRIGIGIVDVLEHHILERDAARIAETRVVAAGLD